MKFHSIRISFILVLFVSLLGCNEKQHDNQSNKTHITPTADNSRNSLDWEGAYKGTLPCADCPGIKTKLTLHADSTYRLSSKYMGKTGKKFTENGSFKWNKKGNEITLKNVKAGSDTKRYLVGEQKLTQLDMQGNRIKGALADYYVLVKTDSLITNKYWRLIKLHGKKIGRGKHQQKEAHFILASDNEIHGNGGCNIFHGSYKRSDNQQISFSHMVSTKMACINVHYENEFLKIFSNADSYAMHGDTLLLNKSGKALAAFVEKPGKQ